MHCLGLIHQACIFHCVIFAIVVVIPGMLNMNPPGPPHRGAGHNHPFFHVPAMPQNMTHQAMHNHFPQLFNNNQFEPFLHNDVLMID